MQDGQTATNPKTGERVVLRGGQWVPMGQSAPTPSPTKSPVFVPGVRQTDPIEQERLRLQQSAEARAAQDQARQDALAPLQAEAARLDIEKKRRELEGAVGKPMRTGDADKLESQVTTFSALHDAMKGFRDDYAGNTITGELENYAQSLIGSGTPGQRDWWANFRTVDNQIRNQLFGATLTPSEQRSYDSTTIRPSMTAPEVRANLERRVRVVREALKRRVDRLTAAGFNKAEIDAAMGEIGVEIMSAPTPDQRQQRRDDESVVFNDEKAPVTGVRFSPDQETAVNQAIRDGDLGQAAMLMQRFNGGKPVDVAALQRAIEAVRKDPNARLQLNYGNADAEAQAAEDRETYGDFLPQALEDRKGAKLDAVARGAADTASFGFADELAAAGSTLLGGGTFRENWQREQAIDEADRRNNGWERFGGQVGGALLNPIGRGATTPGQFARAGAVGGALYGAGSGDRWADRGTNALLGASGGAAGGYFVSKGVNALSGAAQRVLNSPERIAAKSARAAERQNALAVAQAGKAEGVPVSRAMVDPSLENAVTGVQATAAGGPIVNRELGATAEALEAGVKRLGSGGQPLTPPVAGEKIAGAAVRFIKDSGALAKRHYDEAEKLGGDARVNPEKALRAVRDQILELRATPSANRSLISYLEDIGDDLGGGLNVRDLRALRSQVRGQIMSRNLTATDAERRVGAVLEAASDDVSKALSGNPAAIAAYSKADTAYRERMNFIQGTLQKLIGRRSENVPPEKVLARFQTMGAPKGDGTGFGRMMKLLDPEERADIAATFADALGKNAKGEFTTAQLLRQAEKLPATVRRDLFGDEGAESLQNLLVLAKEHDRVFSRLNHSRSGVAMLARDYRSWLSGALGVGTSVLMNDVKGLVAGGAAAAATIGKDALSAKSLMSRDISRWLRRAPKTTAPEKINAHFRQLGRIAARNPLIASEVAQIERALASAAAQLPRGAAAGSGPNADGDIGDGRPEPIKQRDR